MKFLWIFAIVVAACATFVSFGPAQFQSQMPPTKDECGCVIPDSVTLTFTDLNSCQRLNGKQIVLKKTSITQGGHPTWHGVAGESWGVISASFYCGKKTGHAGYVLSIDFGGQLVVAPLKGPCTPLVQTADLTQATPLAYAQYNTNGLPVLCCNKLAPSIRVMVN